MKTFNDILTMIFLIAGLTVFIDIVLWFFSQGRIELMWSIWNKLKELI